MSKIIRISDWVNDFLKERGSYGETPSMVIEKIILKLQDYEEEENNN